MCFDVDFIPGSFSFLSDVFKYGKLSFPPVAHTDRETVPLTSEPYSDFL